MPNVSFQYFSCPPTAAAGSTVTIKVGLINVGDAGYIEPELDVQDYINGQWVNRRYLYAAPQYKWAGPGELADFTIFFPMPNVEAVAFFIHAYAWVNNAWQQTVFGAGPWILQRATPAVATGTVYGLIYDAALGGWVSDITPGYKVPADADIYMVFVWSNTSSISFVGHVEMEVTWPDGVHQVISATQNQDQSAAPNGYWIVSFSPFRSKEGTHTVKATLSSEGVALATVTYTLAAPTPTTFTVTLNPTVTVTNKSTKGGQPSPATLTFKLSYYIAGVKVLPDDMETAEFAGGQSLSFEYLQNVQVAALGQSGSFEVVVLDPSSKQIAAGAKSFTT